MKLSSIEAACKAFPATLSVLFQGPTGVGKTEFVHQLADHFGLEFIDIRLGQMTEGDTIGLPDFDEMTIEGVTARHTTWRPPVWFVKACLKPCLIHFDEMNRGTQEVLQGIFQIALDRRMGFGELSLHPETRIFCSINVGKEYQVTAMDPALRNRFANFDFFPSHEEWFAYLKKQGEEFNVLVDFFQDAGGRNKVHIERQPTMAFDPNCQYPTRRTWTNVIRALTKANILRHPDNLAYEPMLVSMVGDAAASAFKSFAMTALKSLEAEDVLNDYKAHEPRLLGLSHEQLMDLCMSIRDWCAKNDLNDAQARNLARAIRNMPAEILSKGWLTIAECGRTTNVTAAHPYITGYLMAVLGKPIERTRGPDGETPHEWMAQHGYEARAAAKSLQPQQVPADTPAQALAVAAE